MENWPADRGERVVAGRAEMVVAALRSAMREVVVCMVGRWVRICWLQRLSCF